MPQPHPMLISILIQHPHHNRPGSRHKLPPIQIRNRTIHPHITRQRIRQNTPRRKRPRPRNRHQNAPALHPPQNRQLLLALQLRKIRRNQHQHRDPVIPNKIRRQPNRIQNPRHQSRPIHLRLQPQRTPNLPANPNQKIPRPKQSLRNLPRHRKPRRILQTRRRQCPPRLQIRNNHLNARRLRIQRIKQRISRRPRRNHRGLMHQKCQRFFPVRPMNLQINIPRLRISHRQKHRRPPPQTHRIPPPASHLQHRLPPGDRNDAYQRANKNPLGRSPRIHKPDCISFPGTWHHDARRRRASIAAPATRLIIDPGSGTSAMRPLAAANA